MKKTLLTIAITVLVCGCIVGTTYAWLVDKTDPLVNTFTAGDISITLKETAVSEYKMVPGAEIAKDPTVTVVGGSEDCWLFVKVEKANNFDKYLSYVIAEGWTELETGVYYRAVASSADDQPFAVLKNNQVSVNTAGTKAEYNAITSSRNFPELTFTAYAVQKLGFATAADAWVEAKKLDPTPTPTPTPAENQASEDTDEIPENEGR